MGEATIPDDNHFKITVTVNPEEKTICFSDNGIGMTEEEVKEYINQIAFSGAQKFMEKYKGKTNEDQNHRPFWSWFLFLLHGSRSCND